MGGTAHFAGKPIGVCECGPIKWKHSTFAKGPRGVSLPEIQSQHTESYRFKQNSSRSTLSVTGGEFDGLWRLFAKTGGWEVEELSRVSDNGRFGGSAGHLNVLKFMNR
jgi:hypothetical protein